MELRLAGAGHAFHVALFATSTATAAVAHMPAAAGTEAS